MLMLYQSLEIKSTMLKVIKKLLEIATLKDKY